MPAAAVSLISPPPTPSCLHRAAIKSGSAARIPKSLTGLKSISPISAIRRQMLSGMIRLRKSHTEAAISRKEKSTACAMPLATIVEHFLDPLGQGRQHRFPEQGIKPCKEQGAKDNRQQDFDGCVNVALPADIGKDIAGSGNCCNSLILQLAKQEFHGFPSYSKW